MARDPIEILFEKTDGLEKRASALEASGLLTSHRLSQIETAQKDLCNQVVGTEAKLMENIKAVGEKQDSLIRRFDVQDGAKSVIKYIPIVLQSLIALSTLWVLFRSFK